MSTPLLLSLVAVAAYLAGAVPFGYLVPRLVRGVDIRQVGSGNVGATNVGRLMGRKWGMLVFVLDFAKGAVPVAVARFLLSQPEAPEDTLGVIAGVSAFLGHLFPVYLAFKGGKGVATGAGVVAVLVPWLTAAAFALWAAVLLGTRFMALASIAGAALLIVLRLAIYHPAFSEQHWVVSAFCVVGGLLVIVKHHSNVRRLLAGTEPRTFDWNRQGKAET